MANFNRVILSGHIAGVQSWSVGLSFGAAGGTSDGVTTYDELNEWAEAIGQLNGGHVFDDELGVALGTITDLSQIRTEALQANGDLVEAAEVAQSPAYSGSGTVHMPPQSSIVMSLDTGRPGRSYRGRAYWPALGLPLDTGSARIDISDATSLATSFVGFLGDIAAAAPAGHNLDPVVASAKLGVQTPVTRVQVGTVVDTQRRRRDKLVEQYASVTYAP